MATKFASNLSKNNKQIKEQRAKLIAEDASAAHEEILRILRQEERDLKRKKDSLSDLYPDSELSLQVTKPNFDAKKWAQDLQEVNVKLLNKQVEIKVAQETYDEWFTEEQA